MLWYYLSDNMNYNNEKIIMNFDVSFRSSCSGKMAKVFFLKFGKVGLVGNMTGVLLQIP